MEVVVFQIETAALAVKVYHAACLLVDGNGLRRHPSSVPWSSGNTVSLDKCNFVIHPDLTEDKDIMNLKRTNRCA
jgi:hypothetical protein